MSSLLLFHVTIVVSLIMMLILVHFLVDQKIKEIGFLESGLLLEDEPYCTFFDT